MDSVLDAIAGFVTRASQSWPGIVLIWSPLWLLAVFRTWRSLRRRRAFQAFAAAHCLRFAGTIASDARAPYTRIEHVSGAVLLSNATEGEWEGLPIRLFDTVSLREPRWTIVLVTVEGRLYHGAGAARVIAARPEWSIETNLDVLSVSSTPRLEVSELTALLSFATALAKAMEHDAKVQMLVTPEEDAPPRPRTMFGVSTEE